MKLPQIFYQKPWHVLVLCVMVLTSTVTYLITSDVLRYKSQLKLDICLYHLHMRDSKANHLQLSRQDINRNCSNKCSNPVAVLPPVTDQPRKKVCFSGLPLILILTPFEHVIVFLKQYLNMIKSLSYPHCRIRIALGVDKFGVTHPKVIKKHVSKLSHNFRSIDVYTVDIPDDVQLMTTRYSDKHNETIQFKRRRKLAQVRNFLLVSALQEESHVLWIDSDVRQTPADLIQVLLSAHVPIVVPACMYRKTGSLLDVYDRNSWRETEASKEFLRNKGPDYLMLEGYRNKSLRKYLPELKHEGKVVRLDGVGACCMLVDANVHRRGAIFPPFLVNHHIESEGFAEMAKLLDLKMFGMPNVQVIH
ncbi:uncharacterized protein LOC106869556 [Argonauta hians]